MGGNGLDHDGFGQLLGDAQTGVADLADEIGVAADEPDALFLAEAHFPQPAADLGRRRKLLDANDRPGLHMAQWTGLSMGALPFEEDGFRAFHRAEARPRVRGVQGIPRRKESALNNRSCSGRKNADAYLSLFNCVARRDFLRSAVPVLTVPFLAARS